MVEKYGYYFTEGCEISVGAESYPAAVDEIGRKGMMCKDIFIYFVLPFSALSLFVHIKLTFYSLTRSHDEGYVKITSFWCHIKVK